MTGLGRLSAAAVALLLAGGCSSSDGAGDDVDADRAETALLAQRDDVGTTAEGLVAATRTALGGEVVETQGGWEGCTSIFPEGYADFQYAARVQLAAGPGSPERLLDRLEQVASRSGLEVVESSDDSVVLRDGDVTARLWDLPPANAQGDVTIELVADPCVDVPKDDWPDWMRRQDPGPPV